MIKKPLTLTFALLGSVLLASGCQHVTQPQAITPTVPVNSAPTSEEGIKLSKEVNKDIPKAAKSRQEQLLALNNWQTSGAIGVIRKQGKGFSGSFNWVQNAESFRVSIFAPLGAGSAYIQGNPNQVSMVDSKNRRASAESPEALLQKQIGITLPVSNLYYWMRGLPTPHGAAQTQFDAQHRLVSMSQGGWHISYLHYINVNGLDLPERIVLVSPGTQVKFVIKQWKVM